MISTCACEAGSLDRANEDWCGTAGNVSVVLDGATSPTSSPSEHDTPWYVRKLGQVLLDTAADESVDLQAALAEAIDRVSHDHEKCGGSPAATVAVARLTADRFEYLVLADTTVVIDDVTTDGLLVLTDPRVDEVTERVGEPETRRHRIGTEAHRAAVSAMSDAQQAWRNKRGGYWVAADDPVAAEHAITGSLPRHNIRRAVLMSDGAARLAHVFGKPWPDVLALLDDVGPGGLIRKVREIERSDPEGTQWPRFKTSDDATCLDLHNLG
jgi:hypothetical protein